MKRGKVIKNLIFNEKYLLFIYLFVFTTPFYLWNAQYGVFSVILFISFLVKNKLSTFKGLSTFFFFKPLLLLLLFIAYTYLSLLWTENIEHGRWAQKVFREALIYIPLLFLSLSLSSAKNSLKLFALAFSIYALYSIGIYLGFYAIEGASQNNPKGHLEFAISTPMMSMGILFSLVFVFYEKSRNIKIFFMCILLICSFAFLINNGRSAQLSLLLSLFTLVIFYLKEKLNYKFIFLGLTIFIIILVEVFNSSSRFQTGYKQLNNAILNNDYSGSWGIRAYLYKTSFTILKENPIFGVGAGDVRDEYRKIAKKEHTNEKYGSLHNSHFEFLLRYGIVGYALLVSSIFFLIRRLRFIPKYYYLAIAFYSTIFYNSFFNSLLDKKPIYIIFFMSFVFFSIIVLKSKETNIKV
ncbi:MAG: polymerase [Arcobacter sp.]|nr:MAG: polymerase [Arcobacter sp.]